MAVLERISKRLAQQEQLFSMLVQVVGYFSTLGMKDNAPVVDASDSKNPVLRADAEDMLSELAETFGEQEVYRASSKIDNRTITVIFGKENDKWRCLDTSKIVAQGF